MPKTIQGNQSRLQFESIALMKLAKVRSNVEISTTGYYANADGGAAQYIVQSSADYGGTPDEFGDITLANGNIAVLKHDGTIYSTQFGVMGDNAGSPYGDRFRALLTATSNDKVNQLIFSNKIIYFDNTTGAASFQSNCTYIGGKGTVIQPTYYTQRVFLTQNKANFAIEKLTSYINEGLGGEDDTIGGGYWRFESCTNFNMNDIEVSKSFSGGIKFLLCTNFKIETVRALYNQFSGVELEGCSEYVIRDYNLSYNGRYSVGGGYKPLPTGFTGTHGGRGWVVSANGSTLDQKHSRIEDGQCIQNSEYGIRCFAASTKGIKNLTFSDLLLEDNGHPAGTYGTVILASNKGVDALINSDASGESDNIIGRNITINRTLSYGSHISIDGENHRLYNVTCKTSGAGLHALTPFNLFGAKNFVMEGCSSTGSDKHISFGSNSPADVSIIRDRAFDCLEYINGNSTGGFNYISDARAVHRTTAAVAGEDGFNPDGIIMWNITDLYLDGFNQGIVVGSSATTLELYRVKTVNTVANGLRDFSSGGSGIIYNSCQFDSANPLGKSSQVGGGSGVRTGGISWESSIPTSGTYIQGHTVVKINPAGVDVTHNRWMYGWQRLTTGSGHVLNTDWREMWIHNDATTA